MRFFHPTNATEMKEKLEVKKGPMDLFPPPFVINKRYRLGRLEVHVNWRRNNGYAGRFGGGWKWKLGFQAGGTTIVLSLLVLALALTWKKKETQ